MEKQVGNLITDTHTQLKQIEVCAEISINCMNSVANNRPDIQNIIKMLDVVESMQHIRNGMSTCSVAEVCSFITHSMTATPT